MSKEKLWWTTAEIANKDYNLYAMKSPKQVEFSKQRWLSAEAANKLADKLEVLADTEPTDTLRSCINQVAAKLRGK